MKASDYRRLKTGSRVRHVDGTVGTVNVSLEYTDTTEIVWDDGQRLIINRERAEDLAWVESDLQPVTESAQ